MASLRVAIVGSGPWGVYALERLLAAPEDERRASEHGGDLEVVVVDASPPYGSGPNFAETLPDHALLNYPSAHVRPWAGEDRTRVPPAWRTLVEWMDDRGLAADGGEPVPRAVVGRYFREVFEHLAADPPPGVTISTLRTRVRDIERAGGRWAFDVEEASTPAPFDHVLLVTGLPRPDQTPDDDLDGFARRHGLVRIRAGAPLSALDRVAAREPVIVRGMGITFLDVVLHLTEGRGGRFSETSGGELAYHPCGDEPRPLILTSREGLFPAPKAPGCWPHYEGFTPRVFTREHAHELLQRRPLDFATDVWPSVRAEMEAAWNDAARRSGRTDGFEPDRLVDPLGERARGLGGPELRAWLDERLALEISWAEKGPDASPECAAAETWSRLFPGLAVMFSYGGLTPGSHRAFDQGPSAAWGRVAFGPPLVNARKLLALLRSDLFDLSAAVDGRVDTLDDPPRFRVRSDRQGSERTAPTLVEARTAPFDLERPPPLYGRLRDRGLLTPFRNGDYEPGGVWVDASQRAVDGRGEPIAGLSVLGAPTEGCVIGTDALPGSRVAWADAWAESVLGPRNPP